MKPIIKNSDTSLFKSRRFKTIALIVINLIFVLYIFIHGLCINDEMLKVDFAIKNLAPCAEHIFGTDSMGRDLYLRTIKGMCNSIIISAIATFFSVLISVTLSLILSVSKDKGDKVVSNVIDIFLSIPSVIFLIIISIAFGKGTTGVIAGLSLSHWTYLTRILRAEIKQIKSEDYVQVSKQFGKSKWWIATHHILPHLGPQILVGSILMFPHAIIHEAGITFLGFGLDLNTPAVGILLKESMQGILLGHWWTAVFPGLILIISVLAISSIGNNVKHLTDPYSYHE